MRKEIRRIDPLRAGLVYAVLLGTVYLGLGLLVAGQELFFAAEVPLASAAAGAVLGAFARGGLAALAGLVLGVGVGGLYNLIAGRLGGLVIELRDLE